MKNIIKNTRLYQKAFEMSVAASLITFGESANAATSMTLGNVATTITTSFANLSKLMTAASYVGGIGFAVGAIMKFKQHRDNPQQVTIGTCVGMTAVAAALLFLPTILGITGQTVFGGAQQTGGATGIIFS